MRHDTVSTLRAPRPDVGRLRGTPPTTVRPHTDTPTTMKTDSTKLTLGPRLLRRVQVALDARVTQDIVQLGPWERAFAVCFFADHAICDGGFGQLIDWSTGCHVVVDGKLQRREACPAGSPEEMSKDLERIGEREVAGMVREAFALARTMPSGPFWDRAQDDAWSKSDAKSGIDALSIRYRALKPTILGRLALWLGARGMPPPLLAFVERTEANVLRAAPLDAAGPAWLVGRLGLGRVAARLDVLASPRVKHCAALPFAMSNRCDALVESLLEARVDPNAEDHTYGHALEMAVSLLSDARRKCDEEDAVLFRGWVRRLIENGASVVLPGEAEFGDAPLSLRLRDEPELLALAVAHGATPLRAASIAFKANFEANDRE